MPLPRVAAAVAQAGSDARRRVDAEVTRELRQRPAARPKRLDRLAELVRVRLLRVVESSHGHRSFPPDRTTPTKRSGVHESGNSTPTPANKSATSSTFPRSWDSAPRCTRGHDGLSAPAMATSYTTSWGLPPSPRGEPKAARSQDAGHGGRCEGEWSMAEERAQRQLKLIEESRRSRPASGQVAGDVALRRVWSAS